MKDQRDLEPQAAMNQLVRRSVAVDSVLEAYGTTTNKGEMVVLVLPQERALFLRDMLLAIEDADEGKGGGSWMPGWKSGPQSAANANTGTTSMSSPDGKADDVANT